MKVSEIFYSIQGEGVNAGKPAIFLRLALCNLKCAWCDTKYTWDWAHYNADEEVKDLSLEQIIHEILQYDCKHLVVTGGEPLLQQEELATLVARLKPWAFYIEVETNGTILPNQLLIDSVNQWNVSPKLGNSKNPLEQREVDAAYVLFNSLTASYFKFVVESKQDLKEIFYLQDKYHIKKEKILLMPQASTKTELDERSEQVIELCIQNGYLFSPRLHIQLWGDRRGR